jgi:murein DD-endopeptidase MepM/ murein hydrolase activator NlpD
MLRLLSFAVVAAFLSTGLHAQQPVPSAWAMSTNPPRVCFDPRTPAYLNFDLRITNPRERDAAITEVRAFVTRPSGEIVERRILWQQALSTLAPERKVPAGDVATIFNPFVFGSLQPGSTIRYEVDVEGEPLPLTTVVRPVDCVPARPYLFPIRERVLVYDGYDLLSHHRRTVYKGMKDLGVTDNFHRFGVDLVVVDERGHFFNGTGKKNGDWFGWGKPLHAPADGIVAAMRNDQPDNEEVGTLDHWTERSPKDNPMTSYGNYVLIDHGAGEFTLVGHLKQGSVTVSSGERVKAGQVVGAIGNSGASGGIHTHFERRTGPGIAGIESLPPYFVDVKIAGTGEKARRGKPRSIVTGDVLLVNPANP